MTRAPDLQVLLPPDALAPARARRALATLGRLPSALRVDMQLVASELVTNSVRHARMAGDGRIAFRVWVHPTRVRLEVEDSGPGFTIGGGHWPPGHAATGRGMPLLRRLADGCGARREGGRFAVWLTIDRRPARWPHLGVRRPAAWRADGRPLLATTARAGP